MSCPATCMPATFACISAMTVLPATIMGASFGPGKRPPQVAGFDQCPLRTLEMELVNTCGLGAQEITFGLGGWLAPIVMKMKYNAKSSWNCIRRFQELYLKDTFLRVIEFVRS